MRKVTIFFQKRNDLPVRYLSHWWVMETDENGTGAIGQIARDKDRWMIWDLQNTFCEFRKTFAEAKRAALKLFAH